MMTSFFVDGLVQRRSLNFLEQSLWRGSKYPRLMKFQIPTNILDDGYSNYQEFESVWEKYSPMFGFLYYQIIMCPKHIKAGMDVNTGI